MHIKRIRCISNLIDNYVENQLQYGVGVIVFAHPHRGKWGRGHVMAGLLELRQAFSNN